MSRATIAQRCGGESGISAPPSAIGYQVVLKQAESLLNAQSIPRQPALSLIHTFSAEGLEGPFKTPTGLRDQRGRFSFPMVGLVGWTNSKFAFPYGLWNSRESYLRTDKAHTSSP